VNGERPKESADMEARLGDEAGPLEADPHVAESEEIIDQKRDPQPDRRRPILDGRL
jgi:hypothetical protein